MIPTGLPDHVRAALDTLGVRIPTQTKQVKRGLPESSADDRWYKQGLDCPF
jgi:hypothetical protein